MSELFLARNLTLSPAGIAFIKRQEGFRANLYNDKANNATVGYGHLVHIGPICGCEKEAPFSAGITEMQGEELLSSDVRARAQHFLLAGISVPVSQCQYDALTSFCYNVGGGTFLASTLLRALNAGRADLAVLEFKRWIHAGGEILQDLVKRRAEEAAMFMGYSCPNCGQVQHMMYSLTDPNDPHSAAVITCEACGAKSLAEPLQAPAQASE